ncbi:MAG: type VI secretion system tip protein TssI/VgrG, partial [Candidatus Competibacteraceae bacterium]|nr:type VI secretion system tip protein TssI/VgrG [Candidatus Competibacteraceae bacterium]
MPVLQSHRRIGVTVPLGEDILLLRHMSGSETLSQPFEYHLELLSEDPQIALNDVLGHPLVVRLETPESGSRFFHGFVSRFSQSDVPYPGERFTAYRAMVRPWLWFLTRTADCRIFQQQTTPEIIKAVFQEHDFSDFEDRLTATYRSWEYCVQYRETDFNFISRLMEQEGIYYYFRHHDDRHVLVLCDGYSAHDPVAGYERIPYYPPSRQERRERDHIFAWTLNRQVQPGSYTHTDYDPLVPRKNLLATTAETRDHPLSGYEIFDYPGEYSETGEAKHYARLRLEALQAQHETIQGQGNAHGLAVGALFELDNYPREDQNREHLVTGANWELSSDTYQSGGGGGEVDFRCTFQALDARQPFRPPQTTPTPIVQGPQTAVVVGKAGEEIWTDEHGRIKV